MALTLFNAVTQICRYGALLVSALYDPCTLLGSGWADVMREGKEKGWKRFMQKSLPHTK